MIIIGNIDQSFRVKKVCMDEKVIKSFSDVEVKSLVRSDLFLFTSYHIYNFNFTLFCTWISLLGCILYKWRRKQT